MIKIICSRGLRYFAKPVMISEENDGLFCSDCSTIGMSMNSLFHFRGYTWLPSSSITEATTIFGIWM